MIHLGVRHINQSVSALKRSAVSKTLARGKPKIFRRRIRSKNRRVGFKKEGLNMTFLIREEMPSSHTFGMHEKTSHFGSHTWRRTCHWNQVHEEAEQRICSEEWLQLFDDVHGTHRTWDRPICLFILMYKYYQGLPRGAALSRGSWIRCTSHL